MSIISSYDFPKLIRDSGFSFDTNRSKNNINWSDIRAINVDKILNERDFATVNCHINDVINCNFESEFNVQILDSGFVKLFRLSQLSIEFLLQCRRHLDLLNMSLKSDNRDMSEEMQYMKKQLMVKEDEVRKLQTKLKKQKRNQKDVGMRDITNILKTLTMSNSSLLGLNNEVNGAINKCTMCDKIFLNEYYLQSHITRRHKDDIGLNENTATNVKNDLNSSEVQRFHLELKELKERLNATERVYHNFERHEEELQKEEIEATEKDEIKNHSKDENNPPKKGNTETEDRKDITEFFSQWKKEEETKMFELIDNLKSNVSDSIASIKQKLASIEENHSKDENERIKSISNAVINQMKDILPSDANGISTTDGFAELKGLIENYETNWNLKFKTLEGKHNQIIDELKVNMMTFINNQNQFLHKIDRLESLSSRQIKISEEQERRILDVASETNKIKYQMPSPSSSNNIKTTPPEKKVFVDVFDQPIAREKALSSSSESLIEESIDEIPNPRVVLKKPTSPFKEHKFVEPKTKEIVSNKNANIIKSDDRLNRQKSSKSSSQNEKRKSKHAKNQRRNIKLALQKDFEYILNKRLNHLGVPPSTSRLSSKNFDMHMDALIHERKLWLKKYKGYEKIQRKILQTIDVQLESTKQTDDNIVASSPSNRFKESWVKFGSLLNTVKSKAINIAKPKDGLRYSDASSTSRSKSSDDAPRMLSAKSLLAMIDTSRELVESNNKKTAARKKGKREDDDSMTDGHFSSPEKIKRIVTSTPRSSVEDLIASPIRKPSPLSQVVESKSDQHVVSIEKAPPPSSGNGRFSKAENNLPTDDDTTSEERFSTDGVFATNQHQLQQPTMNNPLRRKSFSEDNVGRKTSPKGVLKSVSSTGSLTKKRVNFDLDANKMKSLSAENSIISVTVENDGDHTMERHSSEASTARITSALDDDISPNKKAVVDSSYRGVSAMAVDLENRLTASRQNVKPPVGGIETIFRAKSVQGGGGGPRVVEIASLQRPTAAPRVFSKKMTNTDSDVDLSDWSVDDLLDDK